MIRLTRFNGKEFVLNCDQIKWIEATPDTVITLTSGEKLMVAESVDAVVQATTEYRKALFCVEASELRKKQSLME